MNIYRAVIPFAAQTAQIDFLELVAGSAQAIRLHRMVIAQSTEVTDAQEEQLLVLLKTGQSTSGSGGSSVTAIPQLLGALAFPGTAEANNTTKASTGTIVTHEHYAWNVRSPLDIWWTPETRPRIAPSERGTIELGTTPGDTITMGGFVIFSLE